jgi:hypothetical protein
MNRTGVTSTRDTLFYETRRKRNVRRNHDRGVGPQEIDGYRLRVIVIDGDHLRAALPEEVGGCLPEDLTEPLERHRDLVIRTDVADRTKAEVGYLLDLDLHVLSS